MVRSSSDLDFVYYWHRNDAKQSISLARGCGLDSSAHDIVGTLHALKVELRCKLLPLRKATHLVRVQPETQRVKVTTQLGG